MSKLRANQIVNKASTGAPTAPNGLVVTGVSTATTFSGSGASLTSIPAGNLTGTVADARISTLTASKLSGALPAISGANLTNLDASDLASGTIPDARFPSTLPAISGANLTGISAGITMTDQWRVTANFNHGAGTATITSNWEQNDTYYTTLSGGSMTESSGIFTFPSTGLYLIRAYFNANATNIQYGGIIIKGTTDNFSSVDANLANNYDSFGQGTSYFACVVCEAFFDVTNTSTHKVKFNLNSQGNISVEGTSSYQRTGATFIKFGET